MQQSNLTFHRQVSQQKQHSKQPAQVSQWPGQLLGSTSMLHTQNSVSSQQGISGKPPPAQLSTKLTSLGSAAGRDQAAAVGALKSMPKGGVRASTTTGAAAAAAASDTMSWNPVRLMSPFKTSGAQAAGQASGANADKVNLTLPDSTILDSLIKHLWHRCFMLLCSTLHLSKLSLGKCFIALCLLFEQFRRIPLKYD